MPSDAAAPLAGVRVLDFTRLLPGPVCTLYCADLGADVVKIEDTGAGDYARAIGARGNAPSAFFRNVNRGKRSLAVDLKSAQGRDCALALIRDADLRSMASERLPRLTLRKNALGASPRAPSVRA